MVVSRPKPAAVGIPFARNPGRLFLIVFFTGSLSLFLYLPLHAQTNISLTGVVLDADDARPVVHARVVITGTAQATVTDQFGRFAFLNLPPDKAVISAEAEGYCREVSEPIEIAVAVTRSLTFRLNRKIIHLKERTSIAKVIFPGENSAGGEIIDRSSIRRRHGEDIAEILESVEGVTVERSGLSGPARVRIRGSEADHVVVLIDGQRLSEGGGDLSDLSGISTEMVERIEIYKGAQSARFGSGAIGGVINIVTANAGDQNYTTQVDAEAQGGPWQTAGYTVSVENPLPERTALNRLGYQRSQSGGAFPYVYTVSPRSDDASVYAGKRDNAYRRSNSLFASGSIVSGFPRSLRYSGHIYQERAGMPGPVSSPDLSAWKRDERIIGSAEYRQALSPAQVITLTFGGTRLIQHYDNMADPRQSDRFENRYLNDALNIQGGFTADIARANRMTAGFQIQRNILYHDNLSHPQLSMKRTVRDNLSFYASDNQTIPLSVWQLKSASLDYAIRWDNTLTRKDSTSWQDPSRSSHQINWSHKAGMAVTAGGKVRIVGRGAYGTAYRLPDINSLFWKGDVQSRGNPGLRPEQSEQSEAGVEVSSDGFISLSFGSTYFHSFIQDLIIWQAGYGGVWQPVNLAAARITGHEDFTTIEVWNKRIRFAYRNTISVAKNRTAGNGFNRILTYRPAYTTNYRLSLDFRHLQGWYEISQVGRRYSLDANTKWYDPYRLDNFYIAGRLTVSPMELTFGYRADNIRNTQYVLIGQYPMPGRYWSIIASFNVKIG